MLSCVSLHLWVHVEHNACIVCIEYVGVCVNISIIHTLSIHLLADCTLALPWRHLGQQRSWLIDRIDWPIILSVPEGGIDYWMQGLRGHQWPIGNTLITLESSSVCVCVCVGVCVCVCVEEGCVLHEWQGEYLWGFCVNINVVNQSVEVTAVVSRLPTVPSEALWILYELFSEWTYLTSRAGGQF